MSRNVPCSTITGHSFEVSVEDPQRTKALLRYDSRERVRIFVLDEKTGTYLERRHEPFSGRLPDELPPGTTVPPYQPSGDRSPVDDLRVSEYTPIGQRAGYRDLLLNAPAWERKEKPFPLPGHTWEFVGNAHADPSGKHKVIGLRWFQGRPEAVFEGNSVAGISHMMNLEEWVCHGFEEINRD